MTIRGLLVVSVCLLLPQTGCEESQPIARSTGEACVVTSECESNLCYVATCLDPERDDDRDGLTNTLEATLGTDPFSYDTDGDGIGDFHEFVNLSSPADEDKDGIIDALESLISEEEPDNDCLPDQKDPENTTTEPDKKKIWNSVCCCFGECDKFGVNAEGELRGGAGEPLEVVSGNDCEGEVLSSDELACTLANLEHQHLIDDDDGDGIQNACDVCPIAPDPPYEGWEDWRESDYPNDLDMDSVWDCEDNCPPIKGQDTWNGPNPFTGLQVDTDGDGAGDACDSDLDGDGANNDVDNCPYVFNQDQDDANGDGLGDACDPATMLEDLDGDGVLNLLDCAPDDPELPNADAIPCGPQNTCGDNDCGVKCGACQADEVCTADVCVPECAPECSEENACGDDGCGGSCGECGAGLNCLEGQCEAICEPDCEDKACGDDGCGGSCGECGAGLNCLEGQCEAICEPDCEDKVCGDDGCGGSCGECGAGLNCLEGQCEAICEPDCEDKACGDDGCGGSCGECQGGAVCADHQCVATCTPECDEKVCGDDGCGGSCGQCDDGTGCTIEGDACVPGACSITIAVATNAFGSELSWEIIDGDDAVVASGDGYGDNETVSTAFLLNTGTYTLRMIDSLGDGWLGAIISISYTNGAAVILTTTLAVGALATESFDINCNLCLPSCDGKLCGDDGCGGSCGECQGGAVCADHQCVATCTPECAETAACGDDGCGGSCGACTSDDPCVEAVCDGATCVLADTDCDDQDPCTVDTCGDGGCAYEEAPCDDQNPCTTETCGDDGCVSDPLPSNGTFCDDGDEATLNDVCAEGLCAGVRPGETCALPLMMTDGETLTVDTCLYETLDVPSECGLLGVDVVIQVDIPYEKGALILTVVDGPEAAVVEGVGNSDCDVLWGGPLCKSLGGAYQIEAWKSDVANTFRVGMTDGACGEVTVTLSLQCDCDDNNPCTADSCDDEGDCLYEAVDPGLACDDGDPCTVGGLCDGEGSCQSAAMACEDPGACGTSSCVDGECAVSLMAEGTSCDDDNNCTESDSCTVGGECLGDSIDCDDGDPCTIDSCQKGGAEGACLSQGVDELCGPFPLDQDPCTVRVCDIEGASSLLDDGLITGATSLCAETEVTEGSLDALINQSQLDGCACVALPGVPIDPLRVEPFCEQVCATLESCDVATCFEDCIIEVHQDHRTARAWACHRETFVQSQATCDPETFAAQRVSCEVGCEVAAPPECQSFCQAAFDCYPEGLALSEGVIAQTLGDFELCTAACQGLIAVEPFAYHDYKCVTEQLEEYLVAGQTCPTPDFGCGTRPCDLDEATCHRWSTTVGGNGHYYAFVSEPDSLSWSSARTKGKTATQGDDRQRYGGHLAVLSRPSEDTWLRDVALSLGEGPYWLGTYVPIGSSAAPEVPSWGVDSAVNTVTGETFNPNTGLPLGDSDEQSLHFASYGLTDVVVDEATETVAALEFRVHGASVDSYIVEYPTTWGVCNDRDHDGLCNVDDLCSATADALQTDADADGVGDACDVAPGVDTPGGLSGAFVANVTAVEGLIETWCSAQCSPVVTHCNEDSVACNERCVSQLQTPGQAELASIWACEALAADPDHPGDCATRSQCTLDGGPVYTPGWIASDLFPASAAGAVVRAGCLSLCGVIEECGTSEAFGLELGFVAESQPLCTETCVGHAAADPWRAQGLIEFGCAQPTWQEGCAPTELIPDCGTSICADQQAQDCMEWTTADGGNGHVYQWMVEPLEPASLDAWALTIGSDYSTHVAVVSTDNELTWLTDTFLAQNLASTPFVAATYSASTEQWQWWTGEPFTLTEWAEGEPSLEVAESFTLTPGGWRVASESTSVLVEVTPVIGDDGDRDEVADGDDNCPKIANQPQRDLDGDGLGDLCDECPNGIVGWTSTLATNDINANGCMDIAEEDLTLDTDGDDVPDYLDCEPQNSALSEPTTWYYDQDGDGYAGDGLGTEACTSPGVGYVDVLGDCKDEGEGAADINPGALEVCNGGNNDCDSQTDEGFPNSDGDGQADCVDLDDDNDGVPDTEDCAPLQAGIYPGALDICDGIDNNCNGPLDEDCDGDGDGVTADSDTDDTNPLSCSDDDFDGCDDCSQDQGQDTATDGLDTDGDGICDVGDDDDDGDGVLDEFDCAQFDPAIYLGAPEVCDGVNNDCDHATDEDFHNPGLDCNQNACFDGGSVCVSGECVGALKESPACGVVCEAEFSVAAALTPVGRGELHAIEVVGDRAYLGTEFGLEIYDVTSPDSRRFLGFFATEHAVTEVAVGPLGDPRGATAYLALGTTGMMAVDVRVPDAPALISEMASNAGRPVDDIVVGPGAVYVAIGANAGSGDLTLWTFEDDAGALDLDAPKQTLSEVALGQVGTRPRLAFHEGRLYLLISSGETSASPELRVYDTEADAPWDVTLVGTWLIGEEDVVDVAVRSEWVDGQTQPVFYLTVSDGTVVEPTVASNTGFFSMENDGVAIGFNAHVITGADWVVASGEVGMGSRLFVGASDGRLGVLDEVTAPDSASWKLTMVANDVTTDVRDIAVSGHVAHLINAGLSHVALSVADPVAVQTLHNATAPSGASHSLHSVSDSLVLATNERLFETSWTELVGSEAQECSELVTLNTPIVRAEVSGRWIVALEANGGLQVVSRRSGSLVSESINGADFALTGRYVLVAFSPGIGNFFGVYTLPGGGSSTLDLISDLLSLPEGEDGWQVSAVSTDGRYAYLGITKTALQPVDGENEPVDTPPLTEVGLRVVDLSDPANPEHVGDFIQSQRTTEGHMSLRGSVVVDERVYFTAVLTPGDALAPFVFDVSSPASPVALDQGVTSAPIGRMVSRGGYLYGTDWSNLQARTILAWPIGADQGANSITTLSGSELASGDKYDPLTLTPQGLAHVGQDTLRVHQLMPCGQDLTCDITVKGSYDVTRGVTHRVAVLDDLAVVLESRPGDVGGALFYDALDPTAPTLIHRMSDMEQVPMDLAFYDKMLLIASSVGVTPYTLDGAGGFVVTELGEALFAGSNPTAIAVHDDEVLVAAGASPATLTRAELEGVEGSLVASSVVQRTIEGARFGRVDLSAELALAIDPLTGDASLWDFTQGFVENWTGSQDAIIDGVISPAGLVWVTGPNALGEVSLAGEDYSYSASGSQGFNLGTLIGAEEPATGVAPDAHYLARQANYFVAVSDDRLKLFADGQGGTTTFLGEVDLPSPSSGGVALVGDTAYVTGGAWPLQIVDLGCGSTCDLGSSPSGAATRCRGDEIIEVGGCGNGGEVVEQDCATSSWAFCVGCPEGVRFCSAEASCVVSDPSHLSSVPDEPVAIRYRIAGDPLNTVGCDLMAGMVDRTVTLAYDGLGVAVSVHVQHGDGDSIEATEFDFAAANREIVFQYARTLEGEAEPTTYDYVVTLQLSSPYEFTGTDQQSSGQGEQSCTATLNVQGTRIE
jgi:hypothetical protein